MAYDPAIDTDTGQQVDWWDPNAIGNGDPYDPNRGFDPRQGNYYATDPNTGGGPPGPDPTPPGPGPGVVAPPIAAPSVSNGGGPSFPGFNAPTFHRRPDFSYKDFVAPTLADAQNEPGYAFAAGEGVKRLEGTKAAQGVYRTGGTLKDIYSWANRFAEQNYGGVYNRAKAGYDTNRGNAFDNYNLNSNLDLSEFDRNYRGAFDTQNFAQGAATTQFNNLYDTLRLLSGLS